MSDRRARRLALIGTGIAMGASLLAGCGQVVRVRATGPVSRGAAAGQVRYAVGKLAFPVAEAWQASGDARHLSAVHPENLARLDVQLADRPSADEDACLREAEAALDRGAAGATNVRKHPTTFAGRKGLAVEADQGAWHVWAWAICDGPGQVRISYSGATPLREDVLAAWTTFTEGARFEP
jgi:hypothetical protein